MIPVQANLILPLPILQHETNPEYVELTEGTKIVPLTIIDGYSFLESNAAVQVREGPLS